MTSLATTCRDILLAGLPPAPPPPVLTPRELARAVALLGRGWTLDDVLAHLLTTRPSLPLDAPEAA